MSSRVKKSTTSTTRVKTSQTKQYCNWKIGTINVLTASDDLNLYECLRQCTRAKLDVCCFQEMRRLGKDSVQVSVTTDDETAEWNVWWSGYKRDRKYGVGIAIRISKSVIIQNIEQVSPRLMWIECVCYGIKLRIISAYAPTEDGTSSQKDDFYRQLKEHTVSAKKHQIILCGDMNATAEFCKSFVGGKKSEVTNANDNGKRFANFLILKELSLANARFEHKVKHKVTWYSNTGKCAKTLDYVSQSKWLSQYTLDCRVRTSFTFNNSDHRLLVCRMRTPRRKRDRTKFVKKKSSSPKFNLGALKEEYVRSGFVSKVDQLCVNINAQDIGVNDCVRLTTILEDAAKHSIPKAIKSIETGIWDSDETLKRLCKERDSIDRNTKPLLHKSHSKMIQRRFDQLRNVYYQNEANLIHEAAEARNLEKLFRLSKRQMMNKKPPEISCPGLKEHFQKHFAHPPPSENIPPDIMNPPDVITRLSASGMFDITDLEDYLKHPPKADEISKNIKRLKNKKASSDIPAEFLKAIVDCPNYIAMLESLFEEVWCSIVLAEVWRKQTITALYKNKGSRGEPKNYRGLCIGSSFLKLAMAIILERIKPWYNTQIMPNQNGFRQGVGCPDAIFTLKSIHHNAYRLNKEIFLLFIDLTAAYDWCVRKWLFKSIYNRINPDDEIVLNCVRIMEELYRKTECAMKNNPDDYFETTSGVRQGGSESPCLFNLYLDYIMRLYCEKAKESGLSIAYKFRIKDQVRHRGETNYRGTATYEWLGYADDLVLPTSSIDHLQSAADILNELLSTFGLVISIDKTKTMILNYQGDEYPESIITINNKPIDNVKEFVYLGTKITYMHPGTSDKELAMRIGMANGKFSSLKKLLCNHHIKLSIRIKYYEVYVRSRLCYCCETWTLTASQMDHIESAHTQLLRRMIRSGMNRISSKKEIKAAKEAAKDGEHIEINWAWKYTNEKIYEIAKTPKLKDYIMKQNTGWVAHICRQSNDSLNKQLMFTDEHFTRIGRRPKTVLENVVEHQAITFMKSPEAFLKECFQRKV